MSIASSGNICPLEQRLSSLCTRSLWPIRQPINMFLEMNGANGKTCSLADSSATVVAAWRACRRSLSIWICILFRPLASSPSVRCAGSVSLKARSRPARSPAMKLAQLLLLHSMHQGSGDASAGITQWLPSNKALLLLHSMHWGPGNASAGTTHCLSAHACGTEVCFFCLLHPGSL